MNDIYYKKYIKYKNKYLKLKGGAAASSSDISESMKASILGTISKSMEKPVTEESFRVARTSGSSIPKKRSKECTNAALVSHTEIKFIFYTYSSYRQGQSSPLIKDPKDTGDGIIICETKNTIYKIPKEDFYNGNSFIENRLIYFLTKTPRTMSYY